MSRILIFADDLTGTSSTAAMVHRYGYEAYSVIDLARAQTVPGNCECLSINLDSRGRPGAEAKHRIAKAAGYYLSGAEELYSKRIDSTLRGHLGIETDSFLTKLGGDRTAMIVPALPDAGRQFYGGILYVNGIPLQETAAAKDPSRPIATSSPCRLFREQSGHKTCEIPLAAVRGETAALVDLIAGKRAAGYRNLIYEAASNEDIDRIVMAVRESRIPFAAVDPGAFTCRLAAGMKAGERQTEAAGPEPAASGRRKILAVVGSVNQVAKIQMQQVKETYRAVVSLDIPSLLADEEQCEAAIDSAGRQILRLAQTKDVCILALSSVLEARHIPFADYAAQYDIKTEAIIQRVNQAIAVTACRIMEQDDGFKGLFTCGGDITSAVCNMLKAPVVRVLDEVMPLAVYGTLPLENGNTCKLVSKGGMVGGRNDMTACLEYLKKQL